MTIRQSTRAIVAVAALGLTATLTLSTPTAAQEWDVQLPAGQGSYPTGDLFISNLEAVHTAAGPVLEGVSILIRDGLSFSSGSSCRSEMEIRLANDARSALGMKCPEI